MEKAPHRHFMADTYPPPDHMLRDLSIEVTTTGKGRARIQAPVVPETCSENGFMYVGLLAALVDVLGGVIAIPAVSPDWISTSSLSIHTTRHVMPGRVLAEGTVLRSGRTSIVIGVEIRTERTGLRNKMTPAGFAMITYSRLSGNKTGLQLKTKGDPHESERFLLRGAGLHIPFMEKAGIHILDRAAGRLLLKMQDYVRNSLGSLQGGMTAFLADLAGQYVASEGREHSGQTRDLVIHYMAPGIAGPFQTEADVLRMDPHAALTRIHVLDQGIDQRLMAIVLNNVGLPNDE
jgi:uncharacterized protein (TIGR00369 family)